jgi:hypothetical protein
MYRVLFLAQSIIKKRPELANDIKRFPETYVVFVSDVRSNNDDGHTNDI